MDADRMVLCKSDLRSIGEDQWPEYLPLIGTGVHLSDPALTWFPFLTYYPEPSNPNGVSTAEFQFWQVVQSRFRTGADAGDAKRLL
jgi:hypothetical protein